jgi:5,10-methylenetetrahydromethanopterin reductase
MEISCAFATSPATAEHIVLAEQLGYQRAWCYDSPALYPDVWMTLALAATATSRIGLGPAVLVPALRHPMVNAAAIATLVGSAPGRVAVALGTGFTGRYTLGKGPMTWAAAADYIKVLRSLLRGDEVLWEGTLIKMLHPDGFVPDRPIHVPILIAVGGPKGQSVARELGDGIFWAGRAPAQDGPPEWRALVVLGTVLEAGEDLTSERVLDAAGHAVAVAFHGAYERGGAAAVDRLPGGRTWREAIETVPQARRHLATHEGHLVEVSDRDRPAVKEGIGLLSRTMTGSATEIRTRVRDLADTGVTEIVYQPAGRDIPRELERFIDAVGGDRQPG